MAKVTDELLDHEYDGIREFDNPTPAWWNWIFFLSFVFSVAYFAYYHMWSGPGIYDDYRADMKVYTEAREERERKELAGMSEEKLQALLGDEIAVAAGLEVYAARCQACHAEQGKGSIGPNLTDAYWIHGDASLSAIRKVVAEGVLSKGMPPWKDLLSPKELMQVVVYVGTLRNLNVEGGKAQQGELVGSKAENAEL